MISPFLILVCVALLLTVLSFVWAQYPFISVAVLLVCVALLIGKG